MPFAATWMQLEIVLLSEESQKERQTPYDITCMWNLKYGTAEPIYKREATHRHREKTCGCQGGGGRECYRLGLWG